MTHTLRNFLVVGLITIVGLFVPLPRIDRLTESLADLAHPVLFAALTATLLALLRRRWPKRCLLPPLATSLLVSGVALVSEVAQDKFGRNASWNDLLADFCGIGAAMAVMGRPPSHRPWDATSRRMVAIGFLAVGFGQPLTIFFDEWMARSEMPVLASFEHPWQVSRWFFHDCAAERSSAHASAGRYALRLDLPPGDWLGPSLTLPTGCRDWSKYQRLELDLFVGENKPMEVWFKAMDEGQNGQASDRYELPFVLPPGHTRMVITCDELRRAPCERRMDLTRMKRFQLYLDQLDEPRTLHFDNLRFY